jgi:cysteine dioxygenase
MHISTEPVRSNLITTVDELCSILQTFSEPLTPGKLLELTSLIKLAPDQWHPYLTFDPQQFSFRTVYDSPIFEINIIGWRSGQFSSAHDHRMTACCVRVLEGVLTNIDYRVDSHNKLEEIGRENLSAGEILARSGWEIHRCGNASSSGTDLATLHLYSPPLRPLSERKRDE